ncbi:MAG TPA: type II and III secretion system protein family protein [Beijerinckiaceae bacterium]|nr:type II and III secretion system protein family protein [Beijerinckiaceae bacterium]
MARYLGSLRSAVSCTVVLVAGMALTAATPSAFAKDQGRSAMSYDTVEVPKVQPGPADAHTARRFDIPLGKSIVVDLPRDAKEVFVSSPEIANAVVRTARKIYIIALKPGSTSVFVNDSEGRQLAAFDIAVSKELSRELNVMREVLRTALPGAKIEVNGVGENIVLSGTVDSPLEAQRAVDIANDLVGKSRSLFFESSGSVINAMRIRGKDQVMLKVTVAEVQRTVLKQLGINFDGTWKVGDSTISALMDNPLSVQKQVLSSTSIGAALNNGRQNPSLKALERQGVLRTLAEPTLTAISGESAKFIAGGDIPVPQSETCDYSTGRRICTVQLTYRAIGVSLNFTPVVMAEGRISIRLATEVTDLDSDNQFTGAVSNSPAFRTRKAETTVELPSGGVLATAGLIMQQSRQAINGLPALMNVPILGTMFRSRDYQRSETELMVLVQPFIARPSEAGQIARPDEGFADASDPSTVFMNRLVRSYGQGISRPNSFRGPVGFITD